MKRTFYLALSISSLLLSFTACSDDDDQNREQSAGKVLIETTIKNPDGSSGSSYIQLIPDFSVQSVDNKKSMQVGFDAGVKVIGNDVYIFPEFGKDGTQQLQKYTYSRGSQTLNSSGSLALPPMSGAFNMVSAEAEKEAGFFTHNPVTGEVSNGAVVTTVGNPVFFHSFE